MWQIRFILSETLWILVLVKILKIHTSLNPADLLTKSLLGGAFEKLLVTLGVIFLSRIEVLLDDFVVGCLVRRST